MQTQFQTIHSELLSHEDGFFHVMRKPQRSLTRNGARVLVPRDRWLNSIHDLGVPLDGDVSLVAFHGLTGTSSAASPSELADPEPTASWLDAPSFVAGVNGTLTRWATPEILLSSSPDGCTFAACLAVPHPDQDGERLGTTTMDYALPGTQRFVRALGAGEPTNLFIVDSNTGVPLEHRVLVPTRTVTRQIASFVGFVGSPAPAPRFDQAQAHANAWFANGSAPPAPPERVEPRPGRNIACPCGNTKPDGTARKFKHCCGR